MLGSMSRGGSVFGTVIVVLASLESASAQYYAPPVPVTQTCYQTVPVTEYHQEKQTVQRPVYQTNWVDENYTAYRQVVEPKTVEVPTVSYQNVTEYQTVTQDYGRWMTSYQPNPKMSACQYDGRPGLLAEVNRLGYRIRSAFTPAYTKRRQYMPNVVSQAVPVTRQVAVQGTRQVTYNVARLVPYQATRKVARQSVSYVAKEVTVLKPVTVMKTIPSGTRTAYVHPSAFSSMPRTVLRPSPDPVSRARSTRENAPRTGNSNDDKFKPLPNSGSGEARLEQKADPRSALELAQARGWRIRSNVEAGPWLPPPTATIAQK